MTKRRYINITLVFVLILVILATNVLFASDYIKDYTAPSIRFEIESPTKVLIKVYDSHSGVAELYVNNKKITGASCNNTPILLQESDDVEFIKVYAIDYANNISDTLILINPYYIGEVKPMLGNSIKKSDISMKTEKIVNNNHFIYPIDRTVNSNGVISNFYEINTDREKDIAINQTLSQDNTISFKDFTRYKTYWITKVPHTEVKNSLDKSNNYTDILSRIPKSIDYKHDGFIGKLYLKYESLRTAVNTTDTNYFNAYIDRVYNGLANADSDLIPKTATENGTEYSLVDVQWTRVPIQQNEETIITFSATATYAVLASSTTIADYSVKATYTGDIVKLNEKNTVYEIRFDNNKDISEIIGSEDNSSNDTTTLYQDNNVKEDTIDNNNINVINDAQKIKSSSKIEIDIKMMIIIISIISAIFIVILYKALKKR